MSRPDAAPLAPSPSPSPSRTSRTGPTLDEVYRAHAPLVARWVARLSGRSADVEDLVQDVFLTVQRLLPEFRGDAAITTWLFRITHNVVRHHRRRERVRFFFARLFTDGDPTAPSAAPAPHERIEKAQAHDLVYRALDALPDRYRTAIILFEIEGLPGGELARLLGVSENAVWVCLHRARRRFLDELVKIEAHETERARTLVREPRGADSIARPASPRMGPALGRNGPGET